MKKIKRIPDLWKKWTIWLAASSTKYFIIVFLFELKFAWNFILRIKRVNNTNPKPFKPSRRIKASFYIPENRFNFPTTRGFRMKISMKLVYQYMAIFFNFPSTLNHLHPIQVGNCDSNSRLVVDEDDNVKFRLERVKALSAFNQFLLADAELKRHNHHHFGFQYDHMI